MVTNKLKIPIIGFGAGGHAKVIIDILQILGNYHVIGLFSPDMNSWGSSVLGVPVLGDDTLAFSLITQGIQHAFIGLGGTGDNLPRRRLFERVSKAGFNVIQISHPKSIISPTIRIGTGSIIMAGVIINAATTIGENVILNTGAIIEHDCVILDHVHIATGARLAGNVHVGEAVHIGAGATIRQSISIGEGAIIGAGAVVVKDVPARAIVVGVPAKLLRYQKENES